MKKYNEKLRNSLLVAIAFTGVIVAGSLVDFTIKREKVDGFILKYFQNRTEVIRPIRALHSEIWVDEKNNGTIDKHYQRIDSLRPYHFGLRNLPMEVTTKDQKLYEKLRRKNAPLG